MALTTTKISEPQEASGRPTRGAAVVNALTHGSAASRNPLVVLAIGTLLTNWLVPNVTYRRTVRDARLHKANQLLAQDLEVNRRLNALNTTLEIFHKDNLLPQAAVSAISEQQRELREKMRGLYQSFDEIAWNWYSSAVEEAGILGLATTERLGEINRLVIEYQDHLIRSTSALNVLWNALLAKDYDPADPKCTKLMDETRAKLQTCQSARRAVVAQLARCFVEDAGPAPASATVATVTPTGR